MENGFYKVKDDGKWTVAMKGDEGWYLPGNEFTMEEAGYDPLEEIGEKIVLPDERSDESSGLHLQNVNGSAFDKTKELLKTLTDDERLELFADYCKYCGNDNPKCYCWNDD